jgi:hypothetical protein
MKIEKICAYIAHGIIHVFVKNDITFFRFTHEYMRGCALVGATLPIFLTHHHNHSTLCSELDVAFIYVYVYLYTKTYTCLSR